MTKETAVRWLKQALHDLQAARKILGVETYDVAAFLAHQSVEKLLKALIALQGMEIPRTHNIDELAAKISAPTEVADLIGEINADYLVARYPDMSEELPFEQYDRELSMQKVAVAEQIFECLKTRYAQLLEES